MALTGFSMDDICDCLKDLLIKKCEQYDLTMNEMLEVIEVWAGGMYALCKVMAEPGKHPELERFVVDPDELEIDIPDNIEELLQDEE